MKLYVIRHGQTDWNKLRKVQGVTDIELNERGIEQAKEAREKLKDIDFDLVICSPLKRTRQTADIVTEGKDVKIIYDNSIVERNFGNLEGTVLGEEKFEENYNYYTESKDAEGETTRQLIERIWGFIEQIKEQYKGKKILLVTHGGVVRAIHTYFNGGIPEDGHITNGGMKNCEIREYEL